jgi:hypothetical protein
MATTKTLTPTNQAITLAAFTEKPDNRTNVTNDDKLADAVNALNSKLTTGIAVAGTTDQYGNLTINYTATNVIKILPDRSGPYSDFFRCELSASAAGKAIATCINVNNQIMGNTNVGIVVYTV